MLVSPPAHTHALTPTPAVSQQRLASLFGDAQSEGSDEHAAQLNATALEMAFDEFLETLAAMAIFVQPDPYLSLAHRLGNFLAAVLLPALQVRCVRDGTGWAQGMRGRIHSVWCLCVRCDPMRFQCVVVVYDVPRQFFCFSNALN